MGLLFYSNIGLVKKDGHKHVANNVYCIRDEELLQALEQSKIYYVTQGYTILDKKITEKTKSKNGLKGKIQQSKNSGKDVTEYEEKYNRYEECEEKLAEGKIEISKPKGLKGYKTEKYKIYNVTNLVIADNKNTKSRRM